MGIIDQAAIESARSFNLREWLRLVAVGLVGGTLAWWASGVFGVPATPMTPASLLLQPNPVAAMVVVTVVAVVATLAGAVIAGTIRTDAGLLGAAVALITFSARGQTLGYVLFARGESGYGRLVVEAALMAVPFLLSYVVLHALRRRGLLQPPAGSESYDDSSASVARGAGALLTAAGLGGLVVYFFTPTDQKGQVFASTGVGALVGAWLGHALFPTRSRLPMLLAPLLTAVVGYVWASGSPGDAAIGRAVVPLARPLPLDYAGAGVLGALMGTWLSIRMHREKDAKIEQDRQEQAARKGGGVPRPAGAGAGSGASGAPSVGGD